MGDSRNAYMGLVEQPATLSLLERHKHKWKDITQRDLKETGGEGVDWTCLTQERDKWQAPVNMVIKLLVP